MSTEQQASPDENKAVGLAMVIGIAVAILSAARFGAGYGIGLGLLTLAGLWYVVAVAAMVVNGSTKQ